MIDYKDVEPMLRGMWADIFEQIGIKIPKMRGRNSINYPCPLCGGDDRAHWRDQDGRLALFCRSCAADSMHSPETVYRAVTGVTFGEMVNQLAGYVCHVPIEVRAKIAKESELRNMPSYYKDATPEEIAALLRRLKEAPMSRLTLEKGIGASGVLIDEKTQDTYIKVTRHGETVNVARLRLEEDGSHSVKMLSGKASQFGVTVCGSKSKSVVLCVDWCDAWHINLLTGQQAVCCWTMENMTDLAFKFADHAARGVLFIASNGGFDELADIERANTLATVIVPDDGSESIFKARKFRRVGNLSEWLDEMKKCVTIHSNEVIK